VVADEALLELLRRLDSAGYDFVTPTPLTHRRVLHNRDERLARSLRDVFGWSLPFTAAVVGGCLLEVLDLADALIEEAGGYRSRYRVSRVCGKLFLHSAYPTTEADSVFLGPDTYRFVDFVMRELPAAPPRLHDLGAGCGAGGICIGALFPDARITLIDSNAEASRLARANAAAAGVEVETITGDAVSVLDDALDLVIANPPFLVDGTRRAYRHGGDQWGSELSLAWAVGVARRLAPGGRFLLYTGSAIVDGHDMLRTRLEAELSDLGCTLFYREIDPDIFGEELERGTYRGVERIAAVGIAIAKAV
jgi:methylase of polypeptide subunit release factors